jgi:hypothetical protein
MVFIGRLGVAATSMGDHWRGSDSNRSIRAANTKGTSRSIHAATAGFGQH